MKACKLDVKGVRVVLRQCDGLQEDVPAGVVVDRWGPDLTITRSWRTPTLWLYALVCVGWNAFVVSWYSIAISELNSSDPPRAAWLPIIVAVPHAIGGACLAYATLCRFVNQTRILVASNEIRVHHGPLPWLGNCTLSPGQIKQLFCIEAAHPRRGKPRLTYEVLAWQKDDEYIPLLTGLEDIQQAHFIEREIETFLALTKERVPPGFMLKPAPAA